MKEEQEILFPMFKCSIVIVYTDEFNNEEIGVHKYVHACTVFKEGEPSEIILNTSGGVAMVHIVHELLHCLRDLFKDYLGFSSIGDAEDEVLPYAVEYAMTKIYNYCCENKIELVYRECDKPLDGTR